MSASKLKMYNGRLQVLFTALQLKEYGRICIEASAKRMLGLP